jgi:hypothetical protein
MEQDFEQYLFEKYPTLFYEKDEKPYCPCGVSCPKGWEDIVDNLCAAMVNYSKNYRFVKTTDKFILLKWWVSCKIKNRLDRIARRLDPLDYGAKRFLTQKEIEAQKAAHPNKVKWQKKLYSWKRKFDVEEACVKEYNACPKIAQIKQKFSLRCYVDNATPEVYGMIDLAEQIASKTCEETGRKGFPCTSKGGWHRTLCVDKAVEFGYKILQENV